MIPLPLKPGYVFQKKTVATGNYVENDTFASPGTVFSAYEDKLKQEEVNQYGGFKYPATHYIIAPLGLDFDEGDRIVSPNDPDKFHYIIIVDNPGFQNNHLEIITSLRNG